MKSLSQIIKYRNRGIVCTNKTITEIEIRNTRRLK